MAANTDASNPRTLPKKLPAVAPTKKFPKTLHPTRIYAGSGKGVFHPFETVLFCQQGMPKYLQEDFAEFFGTGIIIGPARSLELDETARTARSASSSWASTACTATRAAVAAAQGIVLPYGDPASAAEHVALRTALNTSSMLQDIRRGAPTEIDQISGAVVRLGSQMGVPTPFNRVLWLLVKTVQSHVEPVQELIYS